MKKCRRLALAVMLGLLFNAALVLPVSAAKPQKSNCGMLLITTSGEDANIYMAVCVEEEDGRFVYSGNHPIEQQVGMYAFLAVRILPLNILMKKTKRPQRPIQL